MAGFQQPITIHQALERINRNEFLLPAFQREFVWSSEQIERLFDSLMKGYPVSSMLFWKVKGETKADFKFYKFLNEYRQWYKIHNEHISTDNLNDFHAVLDGQQRLTSLYIGLCGSYAYKEYRKSWADNEWSLPTRLLYLNVTTVKTDNIGLDYEFKFQKKSETNGNDLVIIGEEKWFRVGRILSLRNGEYRLRHFVKEHNLSDSEHNVLEILDETIHQKGVINYYEEDEQQADKAVNIFIRINSGGTHLGFSDILMSVAVANWKNKDARTEIHSLVDSIRAKGFSIDKDYVLKSFLYLYHKDVRFQINSFNIDFISTIENNWNKIRNATLSLFDLIKTFGLTDYTLTAKNATLPILYYLYHKDSFTDIATKTSYKSERELIKKWLLATIVRRTFSSQTDTVLAQTRKGFTTDFSATKIGQNVVSFPANEINGEIKKHSDFSDDYIQELLHTQKDTQYCFSILALLYPNMDYKNNNFHQDHLHPASKYANLLQKDSEKYGWEVYNSILNLQILDANENMSKNDLGLKEWVEKETKNYDYKQFLDSHLIPNTDFELINFANFIESRKILLTEKLKTLLK